MTGWTTWSGASMRSSAYYSAGPLARLAVILALGMAMSGLGDLLYTLAVWLLVLGLIGGGWPWAPPLGNWAGRGRLAVGVRMTGLAGLLTLATHALTPREAVFTAFMWGTALGAWPLRHLPPGRALLLGAAGVYASAYALRALDVGWGVYVWTMAAAALLSPPFGVQGYPFRRLYRQPYMGIGAVLASLVLGIAAASLMPHGLGLALTLWALAYSWPLEYLGASRYAQPRRGAMCAALALSVAPLWDAVFSPEVTVGAINALVIHTQFWMGYPLDPALPPGMPPPGQRGEREMLKDWCC